MLGGQRPERLSAGKAEMVHWLFANSRDLMHVADRDGRLELVNPAWCETVGVAEPNLIGRSFLDFVHLEDAASLRSNRSADEEVYERDLRLRRADGSWAWFAARRQLLEGGRQIVSLRDATDAHARAEELAELRRSHEMLGIAAGIGMWTFEPHENRVYWSDQLLQLLGLTAEQMAAPELIRKRIPVADLRRVNAAMAHSVDDGQPAQLEYRMRGRRGWRNLRITFQPEPRPGGVHALRGVTQDITELAAARDAAHKGERRMREARREALANGQRLKLALEVAQAGVYEIDHVAQAFWASPELMRLAGEAGASSYADVTELRYPRFHADDLQHVRKCFRALHSGDHRSGEAFEARILDPDGQPRWVRIFHHLQVARNGRWLKAVGLVHDIDADKRQELALIAAQQAAETAGEAKAAFLANMSHEIRTPMNGVLGVLHLLKTEALSPDGRMLLEEALSCGHMLAELLNDVIDFSKIEAGCLELTCESVDPKALVDGVLRLLRPQADAKSLTLKVESDPAVGWVRSDPVRLRQALFNLVGNAVKFTQVGGVTVRFGKGRRGGLRFEIEDTGIGIPAEAQGRIFERFDQGDASTTRRFGGSGLGLAITQRLAQMMGGDVGFTSTEGVGSTFWLEVDAEPTHAHAPAAPSEDGILEGLRILVVEDNATNRIIATKLLEQLGASVETAADGFLGVEAAARGGFDLILMDVQMPGMDGLEAARRVRALGSPLGRTPIVALTANVLAHQRQAYLDSGMDGVVGKPISPTALLLEIARLGGAAAPEAEAAVA